MFTLSGSKQLHLWFTILPAVEYTLQQNRHGRYYEVFLRYFWNCWETGSIFFPLLQRVGFVVRLSSMQVRHELVDRVLSCVCIFACSISPRTCKQKVLSGYRFGLFATGSFLTITGVICFISSLMASKGAALLSWLSVPVSASSVQNLRLRSEFVFFKWHNRW